MRPVCSPMRLKFHLWRPKIWFSCLSSHATIMAMFLRVDNQLRLFSQTLWPSKNTWWKIFASITFNIRKESNLSFCFAVKDSLTSENLKMADGVWNRPIMHCKPLSIEYVMYAYRLCLLDCMKLSGQKKSWNFFLYRFYALHSFLNKIPPWFLSRSCKMATQEFFSNFGPLTLTVWDISWSPLSWSPLWALAIS